MREFDLVSRPWILTRGVDGRIGEVGLEELFATAHGLRAIVGEVPTQTFALVRLLLAILHRATDGPPDGHVWGVLWRDAVLPVADVVDYLDAFRDRFDLLHAATPFYQVADLRTAKGEAFGLDRLVADVPSRKPFFTTRLKAGLERISPAEAARWVVHCQAFDPSGIKSGAVGDPRVKSGKGHPKGPGWAGRVGGLFIEGRTLRETLLLNLIPAGSPHVRHGLDDLPVWERPPQTACEEVSGGREPFGPLDLYTWQSRRIRLFGDGDGITGVIVANGDQLRPQNRHDLEPLSAWRRSQAQEKALRRPLVYMPREHDPERAIWRGLAALLPAATPAQLGRAADALAPAVLGWIGQAQYSGDLATDQHVRAHAIGMQYGDNLSTTIEIVDDAMDMAVALLAERHRELAAAAVTAVEHADAGAAALGYLAANLAEAAGGDGAGPKDRAREQAYAALDAPFRHWLAGLGPGSDPRQSLEAWHQGAHRILLDLGRELVDRAGPAAWVGRLVGPEDRQRHVSTPEADIWFRRQIRKAFELASTPERTGGSP
jgi:CRISPR system Cascade subunit CasA